MDICEGETQTHKPCTETQILTMRVPHKKGHKQIPFFIRTLYRPWFSYKNLKRASAPAAQASDRIPWANFRARRLLLWTDARGKEWQT